MLQEIHDNRAFLEGLIDTKVEHLSYPYGTVQACGEREFAASLRLGFRSAVTVEKIIAFDAICGSIGCRASTSRAATGGRICNEMSHGVCTGPSTVQRRS